MAPRSRLSPNRSSQAAEKYVPPVMPPTKKYRTIHQPQLGTWNDGLNSGGIGSHPPFAEGEHTRQPGENGADDSQPATGGEIAARELGRLGQAVSGRGILEQIERVETAQV